MTIEYFAVSLGGKEVARFARRSITETAEEGTLAFLDGFTAKGNPSREVAIYRDGKWGGGKHGTAALRLHDPRTWSVLLPSAEREANPRGA